MLKIEYMAIVWWVSCFTC